MPQAKPKDEAAWIRFKYGSLLLPLHESSLEDPVDMIAVKTIDGLVNLAKRNSCMILYFTSEAGHNYQVRVGKTTYYFIVSREDVTDTGHKSVINNSSSYAVVEDLKPCAVSALSAEDNGHYA